MVRDGDKKSPPHVVIFPLPAQGHVTPMLHLAELLAAAGIRITFLNSEYNHDRLIRHADAHARLTRYPGFRFRAIPDGLPADHPYRSGDRFTDWFQVFISKAEERLREVLAAESPPVTCVVADGVMGFAVDLGDELGVPVVHFRTHGASCFWAYLSVPSMILAADLPQRAEEIEREGDELIGSVRSMETIMRRRDLPSLCRVTDLSNPFFQILSAAAQSTTRARGLIINTFEDLEPCALSLIRACCPNTYTIGPLHSLVKTRLEHKTTPSGCRPPSCSSLREVDGSCVTWLDSQPPRSVIYVSFGSITVVSRDQLLEFWQGLVNSKRRFLWVVRPGSISAGGEGGAPAELEEGTRERGYMVGWAPQEEVLAHPAVGGFLTHSGWNSTLESIAAGVPMLCWPYNADQPLNSRFVSHVWKIGLDMKDVCHREVVEKMVNDLMAEKRDELVKSADLMANLTRIAVSGCGSSCSSLDRLIQDIQVMSSETD